MDSTMPELQTLSAETTALLPPIPNQWLSHKYKPSLLLGLVNKLDLRIHDGFLGQQGSSMVEGGAWIIAVLLVHTQLICTFYP